MWKKLFTVTDTYKRMTHDVQAVRMEKVGSKFYIYADVDTMRPKVIGRYNTMEEAQTAFKTIVDITNSNK